MRDPPQEGHSNSGHLPGWRCGLSGRGVVTDVLQETLVDRAYHSAPYTTMFLSSRKTKTPISTYSDSYRAPTSIKEVYKDPPLCAWEANKFVTPVSGGRDSRKGAR